MKVLAIKACAPSPFKVYKKFMAAPPQSLFSLAASTPDHVEIELVDETIDMQVDFKTQADIIVLFFSTPDALRGYEIADTFMKLGKTVILAGLHTMFNQEEALDHCHGIMVGETEGIWEELLSDFQNGFIRERYQRTTEVDMETLKPFPTDKISLEQYGYVWSVLVSRGCVNKCSYCLVNRFFHSMRYRPVDDVVEEIRQSKAKIIELHSDNLTADRAYAVELFTKLKPLKIKWFAETTVSLADDDELLKLAAESGLSYLLLGLETPSGKALKEADKEFMDISRVKEQIKKLHKYGIIVDSGMLFGFDDHDREIFDETIQYANHIDLDVMHGIIPIPFPGTKLYEQLEADGRILTKDWSKYDGRHLVFQHDHLTEEEILKGISKFENNVYSLKAYFRYMKFVTAMGLSAMS